MHYIIVAQLLSSIVIGVCCYNLGWMNGWDKGIQNNWRYKEEPTNAKED